MRGNTHADLQEVFFSLTENLAYCRGALGTLVGTGADAVFVGDSDIRPFYVDFKDAEFLSLTAVLDATALIEAAQAKSWGYANPTLQSDSAPEALTLGS